MQNVNKLSSIIFIVFIAVEAYFYYLTYSMNPDIVLFPRIVFSLIIILNVLLFIFEGKNNKNELRKIKYSRVFFAAIITFLCITLIPIVGFYISSMIFLFIMLLYGGIRKISSFVISISLFILFIYLTFAV